MKRYQFHAEAAETGWHRYHKHVQQALSPRQTQKASSVHHPKHTSVVTTKSWHITPQPAGELPPPQTSLPQGQAVVGRTEKRQGQQLFKLQREGDRPPSKTWCSLLNTKSPGDFFRGRSKGKPCQDSTPAPSCLAESRKLVLTQVNLHCQLTGFGVTREHT